APHHDDRGPPLRASEPANGKRLRGFLRGGDVRGLGRRGVAGYSLRGMIGTAATPVHSPPHPGPWHHGFARKISSARRAARRAVRSSTSWGGESSAMSAEIRRGSPATARTSVIASRVVSPPVPGALT